MGGMLYKDFTAIRGKRLVTVLIALTVLYAFLRILFPGTEGSAFLAETASGREEDVVIRDLLFVIGELGIILFGSNIINNWLSRIMQFDEKNRIREYLSSMPISKTDYIAGKYVFIGISVYVVFSLFMIWHVINAAFTTEGVAKDMSDMINAFSLPFMCLILFVASIEIPLYIRFGKEKAMFFRVAFWMIIGITVLAYMLFGNLDIFEKWDLEILMNWLNNHDFGLMLMSILAPVIALGIYYASYRLSVRIYERKEDFDE